LIDADIEDLLECASLGGVSLVHELNLQRELDGSVGRLGLGSLSGLGLGSPGSLGLERLGWPELLGPLRLRQSLRLFLPRLFHLVMSLAKLSHHLTIGLIPVITGFFLSVSPTYYHSKILDRELAGFANFPEPSRRHPSYAMRRDKSRIARHD